MLIMIVVYVILLVAGAFILWCIIGVLLTLHSTRLERKILKDLQKSKKHKINPVIMLGAVAAIANIVPGPWQ